MGIRVKLSIAIIACGIAAGRCNPTITIPPLPDWTETHLLLEGIYTDSASISPSPIAQNITSTSNHGPSCYRAEQIIDFNVRSRLKIRPQTPFTATISLRNTGSCDWTSDFLMIYVSGNRMGALDSQHFLSKTVMPGSIVDISVQLRSPNTDGSFVFGFKIQAPDGTLFGSGDSIFPFTIGIEVFSGFESKINPPKTIKYGGRRNIPASQVSHISVTCPEGSAVTAGGFILNNPRVVVFSQYMEKNGWTVSFNNYSSNEEWIFVEVLCLVHPSAQTTQQIRKFVIPERGTFSGSAECPSGSIVTGAGYFFNPDEALQIRQSVSNGNGWQLSVRNGDFSASTFYLNVICLSGVSAVSTAVIAYQDFQLFSYAVMGAGCPTRQAITGGGWDLLNEDMVLLGSYPGNENWWSIIVENPVKKDQGIVKVRGICLRFIDY